jgi:transketolase
LGAEEIKLTREAMGWTAEPFKIPKEVYADWDAKAAGKAREAEWNTQFAAYKAAHPALAKEFVRRMKGDLPKNFNQVAFDAVVAAHTKARPWPAARPANWHSKPSPPPCPKCWAARPT